MDRSPTRRTLLKSAGALSLLPLVGACRPGPPAGPRPNILFVLADAHRAATMGCYGDDQTPTPAFDRLASEGLRLTTAISSTPICRPYRASLMTGCFGHHSGMLANQSPRNFGVVQGAQWSAGELPTLGATFASAGYRCGYIGKWHLGRVDVDPGPLRFGFDDTWAGAKNPHAYYRWTYHTSREDTIEGSGRFRPAVEADLALDFIDEPDPRPWLLVLSWGPPHQPLKPPPEFTSDEPYRPPPNVPEELGRLYAGDKLRLYAGLVRALDQEFGRIVAGVDGRGLGADTIVVYTSDHGTMLYSQGMMAKTLPYAESSLVPFLVRWPGRIGAGQTLAMPFTTPDILPTLTGLAGLPAPAGIDGTDFSGAWLGRAGAARQEVGYLAAHEPEPDLWPGWRGVRTERYLYARDEHRPWMLFDRIEDPYEMHNLVDERPDLRDELDALTLDTMAAVGDSWRGA